MTGASWKVQANIFSYSKTDVWFLWMGVLSWSLTSRLRHLIYHFSMLLHYSSSVPCQHIIWKGGLNAWGYGYSCLLQALGWIRLELNKAVFLTTLIKSITSTLKSNCCWYAPLIFVKPCLANWQPLQYIPTWFAGSLQFKKQSRKLSICIYTRAVKGHIIGLYGCVQA